MSLNETLVARNSEGHCRRKGTLLKYQVLSVLAAVIVAWTCLSKSDTLTRVSAVLHQRQYFIETGTSIWT